MSEKNIDWQLHFQETFLDGEHIYDTDKHLPAAHVWEYIQKLIPTIQVDTEEYTANECYNQALAVECGEGEVAEAIATKFPIVSRL